MSLGDRQHVEAVAIMRALMEAHETGDLQPVRAAEVWLVENHPAPEVYMAAMNEAAQKNRSGNPA